MKIINIGIARGLFDKNGVSYKWAIDQSLIVEEINTIVFTHKKQEYKEIHENTYHLYPTNSSSKLFYYIDAYKIFKNILKNSDKHDYLVSTQDPIESGVISLILAKLFSLPFHVQLHFDIFNKYWLKEKYFYIIKQKIGIYVLRRANHVRVVSRMLFNEVIKIGISGEKITKIPVFVDINNFSRKINTNHKNDFGENEFIFLSVGRFTYQKNYTSLINVFAKVNAKFKNTKLILVGKGELYDSIINQINDLGISNSVKIVDWTNDVDEWYRTANVYLQPSYYEGWGMAVVEAMASSTPVIMSRTGCADEIVINNDTGLVVDLGDDKGLYKSMIKLVEDDVLRDRLVFGGLHILKSLPTKLETLAIYKKGWELAFIDYYKK